MTKILELELRESRMPTITAVFDLTLTGYVRLQFSSRLASFQFRIADYSIKAEMPENESCGSMHPDNQPPIVLSTRLKLSISRDEGPIPEITILAHGRDVKARGQWFEPRYEAFRRVAIDAANRIVHYLKFDLATPCLQLFRGTEDPFYEPACWLDEQGKPIDTGMMSFGGGVSPSEAGPRLLGQKTLGQAEIPNIGAYLERESRDISSAREFLSDAQSSIVDGNLRRSVLEMAIACEVAIKQAFFLDETPAGAAYEFLESKQHVEFPVVEFLHGPAVAAFSESFKMTHPTDYKHIEFLFRCRNKIAHRAVAYYSDGQTKRNIDRATLEQWWMSIEKLFAWLKQHTGREA